LRILLLYILLISVLYSDEVKLDSLLQKYEKSQALYLKSKKESAGNVIVFSRSDLDKMQAYSLNDILKTLRTYTLQVTPNGMTTLVKSGSDQVLESNVKIFINKHELNSATLGNALTQYGKMSLYFIDHIEIYQASNSVTFGNEPANTVIKLYTKDPSRENGTSTQISFDSIGGVNARAIDARQNGKYSYLVSVDTSKNSFKKYTLNNKELSRDGTRGQFNFSFSKDKSYTIEIGAIDERYDMFKGLGSSPDDGDVQNNSAHISVSKYFDNELSVTLSISHERLSSNCVDDNGIELYDNSIANSVEAKVKTRVYNIMLDKKFIFESNELSMGVQYKNENFAIDDFTLDNIYKSLPRGVKKKNMLIGYAENLLNINNTNLLTLSARVNYTKDDYESSINHILRAGYISTINDSFSVKVFAIEGYIYPTFRQTTFSPNYNINPNLNSATTQTMTVELVYKYQNTKISLSGGNSTKKNAIVFDRVQNQYVNSKDNKHLSRVYTNLEHSFDVNNKLIIDFFKLYSKNNFSPTEGMYIQLFNKVGKVDIYNELIYRSSYRSFDGINMPAGNNYTIGLIYPLGKRIDIKLKGENLLDKATQVPISNVKIQAIDRRALVTMEYTF